MNLLNLGYEESRVLFAQAVEEANERSALQNLFEPFHLHLDNVNVATDGQGKYIAIINGQTYPAVSDGSDGLKEGVFHFNFD